MGKGSQAVLSAKCVFALNGMQKIPKLSRMSQLKLGNPTSRKCLIKSQMVTYFFLFGTTLLLSIRISASASDTWKCQ